MKKTKHYFAMTHVTKNVPEGLKNSALLFFFSKNACFSRLRMISDGVCKKSNFPGCMGGGADAAREAWKQLGSRRCRYVAADVSRDRLPYPPR